MDVRFVRICGWLILGCGTLSSVTRATAQTVRADTVCASDQMQIDQLSRDIAAIPNWNDAQLASARRTLEKLKTERAAIAGLGRRLNGLEESAATAENFGRPGETNYWRRDAMALREQIKRELLNAKASAADIGVRCPGCAFSVLIAKVEAAVDNAAASRTRLAQDQNMLAIYRQNMTSWRCPPIRNTAIP